MMKQTQKSNQKRSDDEELEDVNLKGADTDSDIDDILAEIDEVLKDQPLDLALMFKQRSGQ